MQLNHTYFKSIKSIPKWNLTNATRQEALAWIEALRSEGYKQGKHALRCNDSYCCLGVLSDLQGVEWKLDPEGSHALTEGTYFPYVGDIQGDDSYLSEDIAKKFNMGERGFAIEIVDEKNNVRSVLLTGLNDSGISFKVIADILEVALNGGYEAKLEPVKEEGKKKKSTNS